MSWKSATRSMVLDSCSSRLGGVGEDERIGGDAADVGAGLGIVGVDGVEQRLERGGGEALGGSASLLASKRTRRAAAVAPAPASATRESVMPAKEARLGRAWCVGDGRERRVANETKRPTADAVGRF